MDTHRYDQTSTRRGNGESSEEKTKNDIKYSDKLQSISSTVQKMLHSGSKSNSASNTGIIYYKCLSEEMEKEINTLQSAIEEAESKMITQKQNIKDMIYQKNKLLCDFHEQFRKFTQKIEYENKMEDEIEHLVKFLDDLIPLQSEINYVKSSEINIRNYVIAKHQAMCSELQSTKDTLEKEVEQLQLKLDEFNEWKTELEMLKKLNLDINHAIHLHQEKLIHLQWSIKNEIADSERLRNEGERIQMQTDAEIVEKQQTLKNYATKIQQAFNSIKAQFSELNDNRNKIIQIQQQLAKYNEMLFKNQQKLTEMEIISEKTIKLEEFQKKMEIDCICLNELEDKKKIEIEKQEKFGNILHEYRKKITDEEMLLNSLLDEERLNEEKQKQILAEIKTEQEKIASFDTENTFANEVARNENLVKDIADLTQKNNAAKKNLFELNNELETKMKKINELKKNLLSRNISVADNSSDKNFLNSYLTVENEQNAMSKLIDDELDALLDKICEQQPYIVDLKKRLEELSSEGLLLEEKMIEKEKLLQHSMNSGKICESAILALKQNVYQGKSVTVQDLNKQLTTLKNYVKNEQNTVDKLKEEIGDLTELGKKRRLLSPDKKQDLELTRTGRTGRSRKKIEDPKNTVEKNISQDKDIYEYSFL